MEDTTNVLVVNAVISPQNGHDPQQHPQEGEAVSVYQQLLEQAAPKVYIYVGRRVRNQADAQDIAQQTLMVAVMKCDSFQGGNFQAWLYTIARHLVVDYYRSQARFQHVEIGEAAQAETDLLLQTQSDAVQRLCDCRERVGHWIHCLTRHLRLAEQVAVLLADVHGYQDKEAAAMIGASLPSFKLLLHGARRRLHECAGGQCTLVSQGKCGMESAECRVKLGCNGKERRGGRNGEQGLKPFACPRNNGCCQGNQCRLGLKCQRRIPQLLALREKLLADLNCSVLLLA